MIMILINFALFIYHHQNLIKLLTCTTHRTTHMTIIFSLSPLNMNHKTTNKHVTTFLGFKPCIYNSWYLKKITLGISPFLPQTKRLLDANGFTKLRDMWIVLLKDTKHAWFLKDYNQTEGIDYMYILTIVRLLLAIVYSQNFHLLQLYVNNIFIHDNLDEEVYIEFSSGMFYTYLN